MLYARNYSSGAARVIVLHGGPGAPGSAGPIAERLAETFAVAEPWQRSSGGAEPLSVARHIADLHEFVGACCGGAPPTLVGESWGAMLALAYAAAHPEAAGPLVLIGCGTFDREARQRLQQTMAERMDPELRGRMREIADRVADAGERLRLTYELTQRLYDFDPLPEESHVSIASLDLAGHTETWEDMLRLQEERVYPAAFASIQSRAIMLHGAYDPHPGTLIYASLKPYLPQLEYREWERCGHSPWRERHAREEFFAFLRSWLEQAVEAR